MSSGWADIWDNTMEVLIFTGDEINLDAVLCPDWSEDSGCTSIYDKFEQGNDDEQPFDGTRLSLFSDKVIYRNVGPTAQKVPQGLGVH